MAQEVGSTGSGGGGGGGGGTIVYTATTTGVGPWVLATTPQTDPSVWQIRVTVAVRQTNALGSARFVREFLSQREASPTTLRGSVEVPTPDFKTLAGWDFDPLFGGPNLDWIGTGTAGDTLHWTLTVQITAAM